MIDEHGHWVEPPKTPLVYWLGCAGAVVTVVGTAAECFRRGRDLLGAGILVCVPFMLWMFYRHYRTVQPDDD
jgi:hypothetical protein